MAATVVDSVGTGSADNTASLTSGSLTVSGSNRVLYALVGSGATTPTDPTAVKWGGSGGTSMTQIGTTLTLGSNVKMSLWRLIAPTAQSSTVYASWAGNQNERWIIGVAVQDADQTTPNNTLAQTSGSGAGAGATVNATSVSGDLVLDFVSFLDLGGNSLTLTAGAGQTELEDLASGVIGPYEGAGASSETASGTSTTMSWTISGTGDRNWGIFALAINAPSGPTSHALEGAATAGATASAAISVAPDVWVDTATENVRTGTTSPQTWSHGGAASGVKGVVVAIVHGTSATDHVSACSYGGTALTRIVRHTDTTTEPGAAELWFLGESVPQGTQTVSYTPGSTTDDIHAVCITLLATADLEVVDSDGISSGGTTADPSVTLSYSGRRSLAIAALYGGGAAPSSFTPNGNCETVHDHDLGAFYSEVIRQTTSGTADFAIGGTSAADDVAFAALAVSPKLAVALAGAATAGATASGAIDVTKPLAGEAVAGATASGALAGVAALAGEATAGATADAALTVTGALSYQGRILRGRRNRPGRGPYSVGRYYRAPRLGTFISPAGTAQALAGDAITSAQASAALAVAKALAGAAAASGTASADLALTKVLAGDATASALADAGISVGKPLAGDAAASGLASGALTLTVPIAGAATAGATASGELESGIALAGAAIGSGSADAAISVGVNLAGAAIAGASASGDLLLGVTLAGDALAGALASAGLTILGSVDLEGAATAGATASGSLSLTVLLTGAATAGATASAGLAGSASLAGDAQATGTASAELTLVIPLSGAAIASALASGSLTIVATLAGNALAGATASADLLKAVSLQGEALASGQASAAMGFLSAGPRRVIPVDLPSRSIAARGRSRVIRVDLPSRAVN